MLAPRAKSIVVALYVNETYFTGNKQFHKFVYVI